MSVGDPDDAHAGPREVARGRAAHRAEALHDRARRRRREREPRERRERRLRDAVAADDVAQPDPVDVDGERRADPRQPGVGVVESQQGGVDRGAQADLDGGRVDRLLAQAEVLAGRPVALEERAHRLRGSAAARRSASGSYGSQSIPPLAPPNGV